MNMNYDDKVEKMSVAEHESWMRSRNTMMKRYKTVPKIPVFDDDKKIFEGIIAEYKKDFYKMGFEDVAKVMMNRWKDDMVPYSQLPWHVQEYDRMEIRQKLAMANEYPPYMTDLDTRKLASCIIRKEKENDRIGSSPFDRDWATTLCFRELNLHCLPRFRTDEQWEEHKELFPNDERVWC